MATRFGVTVVESKQLTVKTRPAEADSGPQYADRAKDIVRMATECLSASLGKIQMLPAQPCDPETAAVLKAFFLLDVQDRGNVKLAAALDKIRATLAKMMTGLNSDVCLKIGHDVKKGGLDVRGAVTSHSDREFLGVAEDWNTARQDESDLFKTDPLGVDFKRAYYNCVVWQGGEAYKQLVVNRAIRLESRYLFDKDIVATLIHESSHKYAGTADVCIFEPTPAGKKPAAAADLQPQPGQQLPATSDDALRNADSYAWFAFLVGKAARDG